MERTQITLDGCRREVRLTLTDSELRPHYEKAYQAAQATIEIKGFRKGKVPLPIIKQQFGRGIENDALDSIADEEFRSFVREEKVALVGQPALTDIQKAPTGVTFTIQYEVLPDFELGQYRELVVNRPVRVVTEADVDEEIARITLRAATFEPAEEITDNMFVATISMHEQDPETSMPILGKEATEARVFLDDDQVDMHLRNSLMHQHVGDTFGYVAETQNENAVPPSFRVTVTDIQKVVPAEFTNEFVEQITGGKFATTEDLRADIEHQLKHYYQDAARESVENQLIEQLVAGHSFDVPATVVHAVVHQLADEFKERNKNVPDIQKMTAHDLEPQLRPTAERIARWELIRTRIAQAEQLELMDEDIAAAALKYGVTEEQIRMIMRQNQSLHDQLLAEKTVRALVDYAIINDVNVDSEESIL